MTLRFSEWNKSNHIVDESLGDDIQNWLGKTFGGKTKKIDGILADLGFAEREYAKEWEKSQMDIGSLKGQIETGEISPEEEKDFRKKRLCFKIDKLFNTLFDDLNLLCEWENDEKRRGSNDKS